MALVSLPFQASFYWYRKYQTNPNVAGIDFVPWFQQDHSKLLFKSTTVTVELKKKRKTKLENWQESFTKILTPLHILSSLVTLPMSRDLFLQLHVSAMVSTGDFFHIQRQIQMNQSNYLYQREKRLEWLAGLNVWVSYVCMYVKTNKLVQLCNLAKLQSWLHETVHVF